MNQYPRRPSYDIYVRFRRTRLVLRRGIPRMEDAFAIAAALRASRFHDRGEIFVVKAPEGVIVEPAAEPPPSPAGEGASGRDLAMTARLSEQIAQSRRAIARARAARERFEVAFAEVERTIQRHGAHPPDALCRHQARLRETSDASARTLASCERVAELLEARIGAPPA